MTYQILATKCLKVESMKVYEQLQKQNLPAARKAVSMIVGRDTEQLDETGVAKAAIETVAENASDGVIAPMIYLAVGGPVLGFAYKAVNTMDSMVGYKNEKNLYFGRFAAKLDDVVNFIPSRVAALLMIVASFLPGKRFSGIGAWKIWRRDSRKHASRILRRPRVLCGKPWHPAGRGCQLFWKDCKETDDRGCPASGGTGRYPVCECAVVPDGIPWHGRLPVTFVFSVNSKKPDVV